MKQNHKKRNPTALAPCPYTGGISDYIAVVGILVAVHQDQKDLFTGNFTMTHQLCKYG